MKSFTSTQEQSTCDAASATVTYSAHEYLGDAADTCRETIETLRAIARRVPSMAADLAPMLSRAESLRSELLRMRGMAHRQAFGEPLPLTSSVFGLGAAALAAADL